MAIAANRAKTLIAPVQARSLTAIEAPSNDSSPINSVVP
jgi:hypothetical protein